MSFRVRHIDRDTVPTMVGEGKPVDEESQERPIATGSTILAIVPDLEGAGLSARPPTRNSLRGEDRVAQRSPAQRRFDALIAPHLSAVRTRAGQLCGSSFDPDDLMQDALLRAFRASHHVTEPAKARAWLLTIVTNVFFDRVRMRRRRPDCIDLDTALTAPELAAPEPIAPEPWDEIGIEEVRAAVERLPEDVRETYRLFAFENHDYIAISRQQAIPKATVGTRVFRARKLLRVLLTTGLTEAVPR